MNQKTLMEASYITAFYQNVGTLNSYYAQYQNLMLEVKYSYGSVEHLKKIEALTDDQRDTIRQATQSLRIISVQVYMQYESLKKQLKIPKEDADNITKYYSKITEEYIPESEAIKQYVLLFNQLLTNDIMQDLFDKSQDIINIKNGSA